MHLKMKPENPCFLSLFIASTAIGWLHPISSYRRLSADMHPHTHFLHFQQWAEMRSITWLLLFSYNQSTPVTSLCTGGVGIKERKRMKGCRKLMWPYSKSGPIRLWLTDVCPWQVFVVLRLGLTAGAEPATDRGGWWGGRRGAPPSCR